MGKSLQRRLGRKPRCALFGNVPASSTTTFNWIKDMLEQSGWYVRGFDDADAENAWLPELFDLIIADQSVSSGTYSTKYAKYDIPVIVMEGADSGHQNFHNNVPIARNTTDIVDHPITRAAGLVGVTGTQIYLGTASLGSTDYTGESDVEPLSIWTPTGDWMVVAGDSSKRHNDMDGEPWANRRVFFPVGADGTYTDDFERLIVASVDWATELIKAKPRFAIADVPSDVRFGVVKKPWTIQPPTIAKAKVSFIHSYLTSSQAVGNLANLGTDTHSNQTDTSIAGVSLTPTPYGLGWNLSGSDAPNWNEPYFHPEAEEITALTFGGWFKCNDISDDQAIVGVWNNIEVRTTSWRMELDLNPTNLYVRLQSVDDADAATDVIGSVQINDGAFHHIIGVLYLGADDKVRGEIYVDGQPDGSFTAAGTGWKDPDTPQDAEFSVGSRRGTDPEHYVGDMVGVFVDRTRWSADRVHRAYQNHWGELFEPELVHVPFNEELPKLAMFERDWT